MELLESLIHKVYDVLNLHVGARCLDIFTPFVAYSRGGQGRRRIRFRSLTTSVSKAQQQFINVRIL